MIRNFYFVGGEFSSFRYIHQSFASKINHQADYLPFFFMHSTRQTQNHRVHIFLEMKQGQCVCPLSWSVHCNFTGDGKCKERGCVHPPPSPARANFTLITECTPESSGCNSVYSVLRTTDKHTQTFHPKRYVAWPGWQQAITRKEAEAYGIGTEQTVVPYRLHTVTRATQNEALLLKSEVLGMKKPPVGDGHFAPCPCWYFTFFHAEISSGL